MAGISQQRPADGDLTSAISDAMASLLSRYTGRGATSSWTTIGQDLIVCVLEDALTKGEKSLVEHGKTEAVLSVRSAYQESMEREAIGVVEELSGRRVAAFMSNNHIDPDLAVEIFVLRRAPAVLEPAQSHAAGHGYVDRARVAAAATPPWPGRR